MSAALMGCGHAANAVTADGAPACAICAGIHPGASTVADAPDLTGRVARCSYYSSCRREVPSRTTLAFFGHRKAQPYDRYYCGCWGWD